MVPLPSAVLNWFRGTLKHAYHINFNFYSGGLYRVTLTIDLLKNLFNFVV